MKINTNFGEVIIEATYQSTERCSMDGYDFVETTPDGELYEKYVKDQTTYALVVGY